MSRIAFILLLSSFFTACTQTPEAPSAAASATTEAADLQPAQEASTETPSLLNANLATRADLEAALGDAAAAAVLDARPLLTLSAVHAALVPVVGDSVARSLLGYVVLARKTIPRRQSCV